ncbi:MAG: transcription antitermination factor NusB [Cyclobacteriaceae bacterium]
MQTLFALRQSRQANYGIALEEIRETFSPDLNSMEVQDPVELGKLGEEAAGKFRDNFENQDFVATGAEDERVDQAVTDTIRQYHQNNARDVRHFRKLMVDEVDRVYDRYLSILQLLVKFREIAENDTKRNHSNFLNNSFLKALAESEELEVLLLRKHISWDDEIQEVRLWFKDQVRTNESYKAYNEKAQIDKETEFKFVSSMIKTIIFKNEVIDKFLEERDLNWTEDKTIVKSLTFKTSKKFYEEDILELQEISYNWEEDKAFFTELYDNALEAEKEYESLIAEKTRNWDIERIALTDRIIIEMAIAEMINFSSIPVKVTINEYIEVAKKYSTPKSKQFINGILDVLSNELTNLGVIKKSGRGLIDNK